MLAVGLFAGKDHLEGFSSYSGLFHGGGFYLLGVQLLASICCIVWSGSVTFLIIKVLSYETELGPGLFLYELYENCSILN